MPAEPTRRTTLLATAALLPVLLGCEGTGDRSEDGGGRRPSPLTGRPVSPGRPVLAVKVDNVAPARPHTGLGSADLVYVEPVEGGQTRLLAVFSSRLPARVGPVRSARESDIELLRQFGRPALAYSGAHSRLRPALAGAPFPARAADGGAPGFSRDPKRPAPHNLYLAPTKFLAGVSAVGEAADVGFRFGDAPDGGEPTTRRTVRFPAARCDFVWSAEHGRWLVSLDGAPGHTTDAGRLAATTVVVQRVRVRDSDLRDVRGTVSPYVETVGSGSAEVLRDGRAHQARWHRPAPTAGTTFTTVDGAPLRFAPGPVWVVYAAR